jgi:hypothetical protein
MSPAAGRLFSTAIRWAAIAKEEGRPPVDVVTTVAMSTALYTAGIGPDGKAFRDRFADSPAGFWRHVGEALERVEESEAAEALVGTGGDLA